jgi:copper transport protein
MSTVATTRLAIRTIVAAVVVLLAVGMVASRADAHATLQETDPPDGAVVDEAPSKVTLRFDEAVELAPNGIQVLDSEGEQVQDEAVTTDGGLVVEVGVGGGDIQGTYTVAWRVLSEDGHNLAGSFVYHVGIQTGESVAVVEDADAAALMGWEGRLLGLGGLLVVVGAALLAIGEQPVRERVRRLVLVTALGSALGWGLALLAQTADLTATGLLDAFGQVPDIVSDTRSGTLLAARGVLMLLAALFAIRPLGARTLVPSLLAGLVALVIVSLGGHAWTGDPAAVSLPADFVHVAAASVWFGGLAALAVALPALDEPGPTVRRFSAWAFVAAVAVGVSGSISAWVELPALGDLFSSTYGRLILAKAAGFTVLVALGWWNRSRLVPALETRLPSLLRSVKVEVLVVVLVLGATAALIDAPPPEEPSGPIELSGESDGVAVDLSVLPGVVGDNGLHIYFFDGSGQPLDVDAVEVAVSTEDVPPRRVDVTPVTPSHVIAEGVSFPNSGVWTISVTAVRAGEATTIDLEATLE